MHGKMTRNVIAAGDLKCVGILGKVAMSRPH